jgi:type IV secretory pathway VirB2 component (pilin)
MVEVVIMKKITMVLVIIIFCQILIPNFSIYATNGLSGAMEGAKSFVDEGSKGADNLINKTTLNEASSTVYNILLAIGTTTAIVIGIVLGIQFMIGGAEEQAKVKESLIPYVVGCVIVFGAFGIWALVVNVMKLL